MHEMHDSDNVKSVLQCYDVIHQKNKNRWNSNISQLYKILGTDKLTHLSEAEKLQVKELISAFRDIFAEGEDDLGTTDLAKQDIVLKDKTPILVNITLYL